MVHANSLFPNLHNNTVEMNHTLIYRYQFQIIKSLF